MGHLVLLVAGLVASYIFSNSTEGVPDLALFAGRFHPMVLHFPVGVLVTLFIVDVIGLFKPSEGLTLAGHVMLAIGTHTAVLAAVMGLLLACGGGYDEETLFWHKWMGFGVAAMAMMAAGFKIAELKGSLSMKQGYRGALVFALICLTFGGHEGANLTHGKTFLFKYAPAWLAELAGQGKAGDSEVVAVADNAYEKEIRPILEEKCFKCHGEEKQKGDYRLDTYAAMLKAGESKTDPIKPFIPAASYLVELITLAPDADEVMPPEGKGELTNEEVMTIIRWIANGAKGPTAVAN